ncbi:MAG TPA: hypothetical protein VHG69_07405 [Thermoleophilaceae bacterium]|nr:hypothetical protein [Thermoleophilaceae bacterium]
MKRSSSAAALAAVAAAVVLGACGSGTDASSQQREQARVTPVERVDLNKPPRELTCAEVNDPTTFNPLIARVAATLARGIELNATVTQIKARIQYALLEICKKASDPEHRPALDAAEAVRRGKYVTELG